MIISLIRAEDIAHLEQCDKHPTWEYIGVTSRIVGDCYRSTPDVRYYLEDNYVTKTERNVPTGSYLKMLELLNKYGFKQESRLLTDSIHQLGNNNCLGFVN